MEQTPITAEVNKILTEQYGTRLNPHKTATEKITELFNTKVLEALEREFLLANEEAEFYQLKKYYETEVKPKHEL